MKVDIGFDCPAGSRDLNLTLKLKELDEKDIEQLLERSKKPTSENIGATLYSESPMAALEILCVYFSTISGADSSKVVSEIRSKVYIQAAVNTMLTMANQSEVK